MEDLREFLQNEFTQIRSELERINNKMDDGFNRLWHELADVKKVVRESAEDILENQVEEVARHNLHENKIVLLEASVLDLKRRVRRLEKVNE